jgi:glycosyltransferase involved in cell wall biosynthesis
VLILTNFERFPESWTVASGESGRAEMLTSFRQFAARAKDCDAVVINCDVGLTLKLCALFTVCPWRRKPIVAVDLVLRRPETVWTRVFTPLKRLLFARVWLFIHYFKDLGSYQKFFGIGPDRSLFTPFKPNIRYHYDVPPSPDGEYVLCFGRSLRDYDTFFDAVERLPYPAAVPQPNFAQLRGNQSRFTRPLSKLPKNVRLLDDDGTPDSLVRVLVGARLVVLPILKSSLLAGIGTYLNAMLMRKCVIISAGPGASDVLTEGQALFVPPEDAAALAAAIRNAWEDDAVREKTAEAGYRYALGLGGEPELRQRILELVMERYRRVHPRA